MLEIEDMYIKKKIIRVVSRIEFDQIEYAIYVPRMTRSLGGYKYQYEWVLLRHHLTNLDKWNRWTKKAKKIEKVPEIIGDLIPKRKEKLYETR